MGGSPNLSRAAIIWGITRPVCISARNFCVSEIIWDLQTLTFKPLDVVTFPPSSAFYRYYIRSFPQVWSRYNQIGRQRCLKFRGQENEEMYYAVVETMKNVQDWSNLAQISDIGCIFSRNGLVGAHRLDSITYQGGYRSILKMLPLRNNQRGGVD